MRTRTLGRLRVSTVGLGCANLGWTVDLAGARRIVDAAIDHGVTFLDTADRYGDPVTSGEEILGAALTGRRDRVVLATKFGRVLDDERQGAAPDYVRTATDASLRRLGTDHIDLLQLHVPDPSTPIEDTLGALAGLVADGKVGEIGWSNATGQDLDDMHDRAVEHGVAGFASTQTPYSLLDRTAEDDVLPAARRHGIAVLPYWPLFNGLLSGKYRPGEPPPVGSRIGGKDPARSAEILSEHNLAVVERLRVFAADRGHTVLELAYAWLLAHPEVPSVIAGVSSAEQIAANAAAGDWDLTADEMTELDTVARRDDATVATTR